MTNIGKIPSALAPHDLANLAPRTHAKQAVVRIEGKIRVRLSLNVHDVSATIRCFGNTQYIAAGVLVENRIAAFSR